MAKASAMRLVYKIIGYCDKNEASSDQIFSENHR